MSSIRDLISRLNNEEKDQRIKDEEDFENQYRKQEEMHRRLGLLKEESNKHMDSIVKALDQLTANQCAINCGFEKKNHLIGLPISQEHHKNVVNLISIIISFINNLEMTQRLDNCLMNEFYKKVIFNVTSAKENFDIMQAATYKAQDLFYKTNLLKKLINSATDEEET